MGLSIARYGQDGGSHLSTAYHDNGGLGKKRGGGGGRIADTGGEEPSVEGRVGRRYAFDPLPPERLKVRSQSATTTSALQFQVKTAEGDTVTLSVNAVQQSSVDKVSYRSQDGSVRAAQSAQSNSIQANVSVEGNLSEQELADISKALESLSQGKTLDSLGTLESASFQFSSRTEYSRNRLTYVG
jgi:hypothetical protein